MIYESSVIGILGSRGDGKTALLSEIGDNDQSAGKTVVTNYDVSFPHIRLDFEEIVMLPDVLQNCTLLLDEFQVGAGSRTALKKTNQAINRFITQLRKRNIMLYYTTQNYKFMDVDIRTQTNYILTTIKIFPKDKDDHTFRVTVVDRNDYTDTRYGSIIKIFEWDASDLFGRKVYDTNQIISFGKEE